MAQASPNGSYVCECCGLPRPIVRPVSRNIENRMHQSNQNPTRCHPCAPHRGGADNWAVAKKAAEDHAQWYWELAQQKDAAAKRARAELEQIKVQSDAQIEEAREKMHAAFRSRDAYIIQLARISEHHQPSGKGCTCRRRECETLRIVEKPWIRRQINKVEFNEGYGEYIDDSETETA